MAIVYYAKNRNRDDFLEKTLMLHYGYVPSIYKDEKGKPFLDNNEYISISHSKEYIVLAISSTNIGVDIQKKEYREKVVSLFSEKVNDAEQFTRLWTIKESYGKYLGIGLNKEILKKDFSEFVYDNVFICDQLFFCVKEIEDFICAICTKDDKIQYVCIGG